MAKKAKKEQGKPAYPADVAKLLGILTYRRMAGSLSEQACIEKYVLPTGAEAVLSADGNCLAYMLEVGSGSRTMFSCHTDTCHRTSGAQIIAYDDAGQMVYKSTSNKDDTECLGADDGAGMWMLLQLIEAGVPGTYMFHRAEEIGCVGSHGIAKDHEELLRKFDRAVAFDRRGTGSIITHQMTGRCCSDKFADTLGDMLDAANPLVNMKADDTGIVTDTAHYAHIIPECTNLSCGYEYEHTNEELLDVEFLLNLRDACLTIDWESLPVERDPDVIDPADAFGYGYDWKKGGYYENTDDVMAMGYADLTAWIRKSSVADIAEVIYDMSDRLTLAEDAMADLNDPPDPDLLSGQIDYPWEGQ